MIHSELDQFSEITFDESLSFRPITLDDAPICGEISYQAHKHRLNIEHYDVYSTPDKRANFCIDLQLNKHGTIIENASLLMLLKDTPIGLVQTTHLESWDKVFGWIMDVSLLPSYQGIGYGKLMVQKLLQNLHKEGYKHAGLGVTLSNNSAKTLYEHLGFADFEYFVEIIG